MLVYSKARRRQTAEPHLPVGLGERAEGEGAMRPGSNHVERLDPANGWCRINFLPSVLGRLVGVSAAFPSDKGRLSGLRGVDLKRLAFGRVLETQTFGRLGRARVFEVVDHVGHFHESLTCFERLRRFTIHFQVTVPSRT